MASAPDWLPQAAAVPVRTGKVCLVTSSSGRRWVVPKGMMEPGKTASEIALQEAWEEAGLVGVLQPEPLGSYLYESARDQDPIYRLGMLHYFEAKNIGKKTKRAAAFASYGDTASQHDMDFDWADEALHAAYGKRWLTALMEQRGLPAAAFEQIKERCEALVAATVATATPEETADIRAVADHLIARAQTLATAVVTP